MKFFAEPAERFLNPGGVGLGGGGFRVERVGLRRVIEMLRDVRQFRRTEPGVTLFQFVRVTLSGFAAAPGDRWRVGIILRQAYVARDVLRIECDRFFESSQHRMREKSSLHEGNFARALTEDATEVGLIFRPLWLRHNCVFGKLPRFIGSLLTGAHLAQEEPRAAIGFFDGHEGGERGLRRFELVLIERGANGYKWILIGP